MFYFNGGLQLNKTKMKPLLNAGEDVSQKQGSSWTALINSSISRSVNLRRPIPVLATLAGISAIIIHGSLIKKMYGWRPFQIITLPTQSNDYVLALDTVCDWLQQINLMNFYGNIRYYANKPETVLQEAKTLSC